MAVGVSMLAAVTADSAFAGGGSTWWQTLGGLLAVFGLLLLSLKLLGKWNRRQGANEASVLTVWHLGPKREIQVLRLGADVHYIYRHENAMVLLKQEPLADFEAQRQADDSAASAPGWQRFFPKGLPFSHGAANSTSPAPDLTTL